MGDFSRILLHGIADHIVKGNDTQAFVLASGIKGVADMATTIPETVYMMFQMTFAIITPALIAGAFADRMKFSAMCIFMTLWSLLVYSPIAHWCGRLPAGPTNWACSTSQAAPWFISMPVSPDLCARWCLANAPGTRRPTWRV